MRGVAVPDRWGVRAWGGLAGARLGHAGRRQQKRRPPIKYPDPNSGLSLVSGGKDTFF